MQTNELADRIGRFIEQTKPYWNLTLGAVLLVLLGVAAAIWWMQRSADQTATAWEGFYGAMAGGGPAEFEEIADRYPGTDVANWAAVLAGDLYAIRGSQDLFDNKASANEQLQKSVNQYLRVLQLRPTRHDAQEFLVRKLTAMPRLVRALATVLLLALGVTAFYLAFVLGLTVGRKLGTADAHRYWPGVASVAIVLAVLAVLYLALPAALAALGQDPSSPGLAMLKQRAAFGIGRAYESLAGTRQSQGELDKAIEAYQGLVDKWPHGAYHDLAARRLEELGQRDTKAFYDKFAQFDPKPPLPDVPGATGGGPEFDLDSLSDEGAFTRLSESLGLDDSKGEETATEKDSPGPVEPAAPGSAEPDAPAEQDQAGPEESTSESPTAPEEASPDDAAQPEKTSAKEPSESQGASGQE